MLALDPTNSAKSESPVTNKAQTISVQIGNADVLDTKAQSMIRDGKLQPASLFNYDWVQKQLEKPLEEGKKFMFVKDSALAIYGHYDKLPNIPFRHTFLIRHPQRIAVSLRRCYVKVFHSGGNTDNVDFFTGNPNAIPSGNYGSDPMLATWNYVRNNIDPNPIVIDADDLSNYPEIILKKYCQAVGIEYHDKYLQWDGSEEFLKNIHGPQEQVIWGKDVGFYGTAFFSTYFEKIKSEIPKLENMSPDCRMYAKNFLDGYYEMYETRIKPLEE